MYGYIYLILNKVNGKTYVGKHKLYKKAWNEDGYLGSGKLLKPAQEKYGIENFEKFLIRYTDSEEDACEKEEFWIAHYRELNKAEYNIAKGGQGGNTYFRTKEHNKKMSEALKGDKNPWYGKHHSEETRKKMAKAHKGKSAYWNIGRHPSEETRKKLSEVHKGKPSGRKGKPSWNKGKKCGPLSKETKSKLSASKQNRHWYNNGQEEKWCSECPEGFVPGRLR